MPWAFVQSNVAGSTPSTATRTLAYSSNVAAGDLLVVAVGTFNAGITVTVTDSQGNAYSQVGSYGANGSSRVSLWVAIAGSSGANTVSVTPSASAYMGLGIAEYSGNASSSIIDGNSTNSATGTAVSTGSIAVNSAGELALGVFTQGTGTITLSASAGFNTRCSQPNGATNMSVYLLDGFPESSATNVAGTFSVTAAWAAEGGSIKAASGGPWPWFFDRFCAGSGRGMTGGMFG